MSNRLSAVLVSCLFAAACGGGNTGTSTSGGGATSGGTTGAATTTGGTAGSLRDGAVCSANADCRSGVCGLNGSGNCCQAACGGDGGACDATGCDNRGACTFPVSSTACKDISCAAGKLTAFACDGTGSCAPQPATTCAQHLGCTGDGTACAASCASSAECAPSYVCNAGACVGPKNAGACTENDDCFSNHCGLDGGGHCCSGATACASGDPICGAADCDAATGACAYASVGMACGSTLASCSDGVAQGASACDGQGACNTPGPAACTPFICGVNACLATCADSSSCAPGDFCDTDHASCCTALASGTTITVDGTAGNDATPCCSVPGYGPCQTITEVMKQIDAAQAQNVTIQAVLRTGGKTWAPPGEIYPIVLGWGAELSAPNMFFSDIPDAGNTAIFQIQAVSARDTVGYASIAGSGAGPITIGDDEFRFQTFDPTAIRISGGSTLYLASAQLDSNEEAQNAAITIAAGGGLVLAEDQAGANTGSVTIGYPDINRESEWGYAGIVCESSKTAGCTISDTVLDGGSSLVILGQSDVDIDAEDFAQVTLTGNPTIGLLAGDAGFNVCFEKVDGQNSLAGAAILLHGSASMTFENGFIQCVAADAFDLTASGTGVPTLTLGNTTIENVDTAVDVFAGTATITGSTIEFNANGVAQTTDGTNYGTVKLNGGDAGNTVICSDSSEEGGGIIGGGFGTVGVSVSNSTPNTLDADNVTWDTAGPDLFRCDAALETCTCQISSCAISTADGGVDGMDAVEIGDAGVITTAGNQLSDAACNFPPPEPPPPECKPPCVGMTVCCPFVRPVACVPFQQCQ